MPVWKFFCSKKRCSNLLFILIIRQKDKDRSSALVESFLGKEELRKVILFHIDNRVKVRTKAWWNSFKLCRELHFNFIYIDILLASLFFPSSDIKGNTKHYTEYKYKKLCKDLGNTMCLQYKVNCSVIKSRLTLWDPMDYSVPGLPVPQCLGVFSSSCPLSRWCYPTFSSAATLFFYLQSFPAPGSFPMSQLFASGGQVIGASASASVLVVSVQDWFPLELTGFISFQSKGFSRVFSNTTAEKHQFFGAQLSLWSNSHIHTRLPEKHSFD